MPPKNIKQLNEFKPLVKKHVLRHVKVLPSKLQATKELPYWVHLFGHFILSEVMEASGWTQMYTRRQPDAVN